MKPLCVVSCPIDTFSGYGARSRDFVKSLIEQKDSEWDIKILPQRWGDCPWNFLSKDDPLRQRFIGGLEQNPTIWVQITVPNEFQPIGQFNIGVTAGIETTIFPAEFLEGMNKMNLNLVSSNHSKNIALSTQFEKKNQQGQIEKIIKLNKPVEVLFEGLDLDKYYKNPNKTSILDGINEEFCFLYTGHWLPGKTGEDRKNTGLMIKTFLETFNTPSKKKPALILKTNHVNYSLMDRTEILKKINEIKSQVKGNLPNIYLLHGEMTDDEMNELNNDPRVKSFVSFTKGEGFGRPLLEAAITGKPVITTNWSGHIDFLHSDYNILIGGELKNVHKSAANQFLLKDSQWFNINTSVASRAMKDVFNHYKKYTEKSRKQTQYLKDNFSIDKMGKALNKFIPTIQMQPQQQTLNLPKLQKTSQSSNGLKLPKLKKLGDSKEKTTSIKLPKLKKVEL